MRASRCRRSAPPCRPPRSAPATRSRSSTPPARPASRRASAARTRSSTGGAYQQRVPRDRRARRLLHDAAAVPHQRDQQPLPGARRGRRLRQRAALHGDALLAAGARVRRDAHLSARGDGQHAARAARRRERPRALGARSRSRPARRPRCTPRSPSASASSCATASARRRPTTSPASPATRSGPARWVARSTSSSSACVDGDERQVARRRAGRAGRARPPPVQHRDRLLRHARGDRSRLARRLVPHRRPRRARRRRLVSLRRSRQGRDPPPRREHLLASRSSRSCSSTPRSAPRRSSRSPRSWPRTR